MRKHTVETFMAQISPEPNSGCWLWTGAINNQGYGSVTFQRKVCRPHRLVYLLETNENIDGLELHHLCEQKTCCNPSHLVPMTKEEHSRNKRKINACKKRGHPFTPNTPLNKNNARRCVSCESERTQRRILNGEFRKGKKEKTHCIHGHPYTSENVGVYDDRRYCRVCVKIRAKIRWQRSKRV